MGVILISFSTQWFINSLPGSEINGVPASDIKDKILPSLIYLMTFSYYKIPSL